VGHLEVEWDGVRGGSRSQSEKMASGVELGRRIEVGVAQSQRGASSFASGGLVEDMFERMVMV
jgi:hypothetical protein